MSAFVLCSSCKRHVRSGDVTCPFCDAAIVVHDARAVERRRGLSRAKVYALQAVALATGVTTAALASGCGSSDSSTNSTDGGSDTAQGGDGQSTDTGSGTDTATGGDTAGGDTASGDTGTSSDTATDDGGTDTNDTGFCCPPYGCVFPHDGCVTRV